jgi:Na+-translocating ferredoxin:NAD+ oxidoreductase RnfG subunit
MIDAARWAVPLGLVVFSATPGYAIHYLAVDEAQRACFPGADQFVVSHVVFTPAQIQKISALSGQRPMARGQQVWKALKGGKLQGWLVVDYVIGKHLAIDYAVALSPTGSVRQIEILEYRESYGGEIHSATWRKQFDGKTSASPLKLNDDITNISGATLSCRHVTEGVKRVLATYETCLKDR